MPGGRSLLAVIVAHAFAVVLVSHCHYAFRPPTRQLWIALELVLALLLWLPARWYLGHVLPERRWLTIGVSLGLGFLVASWWHGSLADTLWLFVSPESQALLKPLLFASQSVVLATAFAGLLALTRLAAPSSEPEQPAAENRQTLASLAGLALFLLTANAFAIWYVRQEQTIYYWDFITYWTITGDLGETLRTTTPAQAWDDFRHRTRTDDYGPLPALLPAAFTATFGDTRLVYILAIVNLYLGGLAVAVRLFVRRFLPSAGLLGVIVPLALLLVSTPAWAPLLRGYLDIGGAAVATLALLVYLSRPAGQLTAKHIVLLAALLVGMTLFRRWYSFFVVAFFLVIGLDVLLATLLARPGWREAIRRLTQPVLIGVWSATLLFAFAANWVVRVATTSYADDYSAYRTAGQFGERAWRQMEVCGFGAIAAAGLGFLILLTSRDTRRAALVIGGMAPIMLVHFLKIQDFGTHHFYLFLPALMLLPSLGVLRLVSGPEPTSKNRSGPSSVAGVSDPGALKTGLTEAGYRNPRCVLPAWARWPVAVLPILAGAAAMFVTFTPQGLPHHKALEPAVPDLYLPPLTRSDLPEFRCLLRDTESAAEQSREGRVAVVASSLAVNWTHFSAADRSLGEPLFQRRRLLFGGEVDARDGFPWPVFQADVVVVAYPPQTHLAAAEQQAVVLTAESIWNRTDIGLAFERLPGEYHLEDGVTVRLYRRARPIPSADFQVFCDRLKQAHPNRPAFFTPPDGVPLNKSAERR